MLQKMMVEAHLKKTSESAKTEVAIKIYYHFRLRYLISKLSLPEVQLFLQQIGNQLFLTQKEREFAETTKQLIMSGSKGGKISFPTTILDHRKSIEDSVSIFA